MKNPKTDWAPEEIMNEITNKAGVYKITCLPTGNSKSWGKHEQCN